MGRHFAGYLGVAVVAMTTTIWGTFDPSVMYYNTSNGNFGLGTDAPQTYLHLKNQNPVITLMTTSAGQTVDNNGTNNGWMGLLFMSPTTNGGTARSKWDMTYSARDQQLYFYDYNANRKTLMLPDAGMPVINGGLVVSGSVGIGTQTPDAALHVAKYVLNGEYLAQHLQNLGGGTSIVTFKIGEGTPESQYGILGHYGADNSFRIGAVGPSGNHSLQFHTGNTSGTQLTSERMRITHDGKVGIGTIAPGELFTVQKSVYATVSPNYFVGLNLRNGLDGGNRILFSNSVAATLAAIDGTVTSSGAGTDDGVLTFLTSTNGAMGERMRIDALGNVGIGTTRPTEKMDISGNIQLSMLPARVGFAVADTFTYDGDALANYGLSIYNDTTGFPAAGNMVALSGYRGIRFFAGGGHAMSISGAGNVGIGTLTPVEKLEVSGNVKATRFIGDGSQLTGVVGGLSNVLMVSTSGNIGIGTATPTARLHVVGTMQVDGVLQATDIVTSPIQWADRVFDPNYKLMPLDQVESYITTHRHLPEVPSEAEVLKNGTSLVEMQTIQMQKIEELTLYIVQLKRQMETMQDELRGLKSAQH